MMRREERRAARDLELALFDETLRSARGLDCLAGADEAGRGPLAGPVVAAAVVLPPGLLIPGADDSKALPPDERERLNREIRSRALAFAVAVVPPSVIDRINILEASREAVRRAVARLAPSPRVVIMDGWPIPALGFPQVALPRADGRSLSVACASILAKVRRDRIMVRYARQFPQYGFHANKGYGTPEHLAALDRHGPCPLHRRSFAPVVQTRLAFELVKD